MELGVGKCWCGQESLNSWGECLGHTLKGSEPKSLNRENNQMADFTPIPYLRNLISHIPRFLSLRRDTIDKDVHLHRDDS